ncbi:MAG: hypothetical protein LBI45_05385 [Bacteroidales bacterium]|nr:hypothetical protein [Bacteroidales bacterium]
MNETTNHLPKQTYLNTQKYAAMKKGYFILSCILSLVLFLSGTALLIFLFQTGTINLINSLIIAPAIILTAAVISVSIYKRNQNVKHLFERENNNKL